MKISSKWARGKAGFVLSTISLSVIVISIIAAITLYGQKPHEIVLTSFMCLPESTNQTFTITAEVNLTDGMDETEAITLASRVFDFATHINETDYVVQSSSARGTHYINQTAETWKVTMERIYTTTLSQLGLQYEYKDIMLQIHCTLQATIDPTNKTIQYNMQSVG